MSTGNKSKSGVWISQNSMSQGIPHHSMNTMGALAPPPRNPKTALAMQQNQPYAALSPLPRQFGVAVADPDLKSEYFQALNQASLRLPLN